MHVLIFLNFLKKVEPSWQINRFNSLKHANICNITTHLKKSMNQLIIDTS